MMTMTAIEVFNTIGCMIPKKWWICKRSLAMTLGFTFQDSKGCLYPDRVKEGLKKKPSIIPEEVHVPNELNLTGKRMVSVPFQSWTDGYVWDTPKSNCSRAHFRSFFQIVLMLAVSTSIDAIVEWFENCKNLKGVSCITCVGGHGAGTRCCKPSQGSGQIDLLPSNP